MAIEFKSRTFTISPLNDEGLKALKEDAEILSNVNVASFPQVIDSAKEIILAKTERDELALEEGMVTSRLVPNRQTALAAYRFIRYFFKIFADDSTKEDSPEDIVKDLEGIGLSSNITCLIAKIIELIKQEAKWYEYNRLKESFSSGLFPSFRGIGTTVELRGVFNREIKYGEKVEDYAKEAKLEEKSPMVPVISIAITLDSGTPSRFIFQASPEETEWLIEELKASKIN